MNDDEAARSHSHIGQQTGDVSLSLSRARWLAESMERYAHQQVARDDGAVCNATLDFELLVAAMTMTRSGYDTLVPVICSISSTGIPIATGSTVLRSTRVRGL